MTRITLEIPTAYAANITQTLRNRAMEMATCWEAMHNPMPEHVEIAAARRAVVEQLSNAGE